VPQTVLLGGTAVLSSTTLTLTSNAGSALVGQAITFSACTHPVGAGTPTGTVSFFDGSTQIGNAQTLINGVATLTTSMLLPGIQDISAVYSGGSTTFMGSTSGVMAEDWVDFTLSPVSAPPGGATQTVSLGAAATYNFSLSPLGGAFNFPVTFSAAGLPPGAIATFTPTSAVAGTMPGDFVMVIQTATLGANLTGMDLRGTGLESGAIMLGFLLLPFIRRTLHKGHRIMMPSLFAVLVGFAVVGCITGCGSLHRIPQTYTVNVTGTATGTSGLALAHSTVVTLTVQ